MNDIIYTKRTVGYVFTANGSFQADRIRACVNISLKNKGLFDIGYRLSGGSWMTLSVGEAMLSLGETDGARCEDIIDFEIPAGGILYLYTNQLIRGCKVLV